MKNKLNKGFTLIELLVVISIIALLSSIVLASIKDARSKAVEASYRSHLKQVGVALELYRNANGKYPPNIGGTFSIFSAGFINDMSPYIKLEPAPTFVNIITDPRPHYQNRDTGNWSYSCGRVYNAIITPKEEPWVIYFESNSKLGFPRLYNDSGPFGNFYCSSLLNS